MTVGLTHFLIVCPLALLAGFIDAVAGGGGLITLPAYMIVGLPAHFAIGTNKLSSTMGTSVATARFALKGFIPWKQALFCVLLAFAGSSLGANLALMIQEGPFQVIMLIILPLTALYVLRGRALKAEKPPFSQGKTLLISMAAAFVIGIYDGFYGPGTGTFLILAMTAIAHMSLRSANGITKAINLTTNIAALTVYLLNGRVLIPLGLTAGVFNIAGNWLGARFFERRGAVAVKPVMLAVLAIFFLRIILEKLGVL